MGISGAYKLYCKIYWYSNNSKYVDIEEIAWKHNAIDILWSWSLFSTPFFLNLYILCCLLYVQNKRSILIGPWPPDKIINQ